MLKSFIWPGFLLLLLAQWLVPLQMIWKKESILSKGISYKFETAPVDPSNPFMGKYIVLNFKEDAIKMAASNDLANSTTIFVTFTTGKDGFARVGSVNSSKPQRPDYLETTIKYFLRIPKDSVTISLNYPFTRYYMEEYKAPLAENIYWERKTDTSLKTYAVVNIYNGDAIIKDVYINDTLVRDIIRIRNRVR